MKTQDFKKLLPSGAAALALVFTASVANAQATGTGTDSVDPGSVDNTGIENIATVTGTYDGASVSNDAFEEVPVETADPNIAVVKTATIGGSPVPLTGAVVGDIITYTYTIQNTGNVVLADVGVVDDHYSAAGATNLTVGSCSVTTDATVSSGGSTLNQNDTVIVAGTAPANDTFTFFGPDDVVTCTATYTVTQADVDSLQ